ncbi:MAG: SpaA isopeptide-forming pilin-related protein [Candidatus Limivicinus sp.]|nr:SpaA isopeptide-forming pilin-related protein [Candidatus Limivicinus sp.]
MKRVLSALLCILMIVSVFASGTTAYADKGKEWTMEEAKKVYERTTNFDHIDIRVAGNLTIDGVATPITVSYPRVEVYTKDNEGNYVKSDSWSFQNQERYEWRKTGLRIPKNAIVVLTCDITINNEEKKDLQFTFQGEDDFIRAIYICDGHQGLDFDVDEEQIKEEYFYQVSYQWTGLPTGLAQVPTDSNHYQANEQVTVDTTFPKDRTILDGEDVYTFSGWTEYEPENGTRTPLNGAASFEITADTVIYGSWSKYTPPTTEPGSITITKQFEGLPDGLRPEAISFKVESTEGAEVYSNTVTLNAENGWSATISGLSEGSYIITEGAADVDGYVYASNFTGGSTTVTLTKSALDTDTNKYTVSSESVTFKNTYTRLGSLKIVKDFGADSELNKDSANIGKFVFTVAGPDGFETRTIELPIASSETPWEFTLENLPAGDYTVTEDPASAARDSYVLTINGPEAGDDAVIATVVNGSTAEAKITNTYTKNMGEEIHNPASFKIVKTDEQGNKLSGAEFTLTPENGGEAITQTTDANGEAVFSGFVNEAKYTLKETKAPEGYVAAEQTWTVTVKLKDGDPTVQISQDGSFWNKIYNWVVSTDPEGVDGVLTVTNKRQTGSLTITKTVENNKKLGPEAEEYTFSLTIGNEEQSFTLKDGESKTVENIPYGTAYTVLEEVGDDASWNVKAPADGIAEGTITQEKTTVNFVNRYEYADAAEMVVFSAVKQSSKDGKALAGAEFTVYSDKECKTSVATAATDASGKLAFGFKSAGSFYLKETKAPSGYVLSDKVVELTVSNKGYAVDKVQNEDQSVTITIVPLLELNVKGAELQSGSTSVFVLKNDPESYIDITVNKLWKNDKEAGKRPETITVTLYKDGVKYDSKTISEKDKWTCTWKNLPSQYKWTVDESNLPAGYTKSITQKGNTFTITNTYSSIPGTGDSSAPILWALLVLTTAAGAVLTIRKLRKEKG